MLTNLWFIILIFTILNTFAKYDQKFANNVGTVLFSSRDIKNNAWSTDDISLLQARRYFQTVLPPPRIFKDLYADNIDSLLEYFKEAYRNIRRQAKDQETDSIMTKALSDTLGGYLKMWILPVTKLNFYGGTVSHENVMKLHELYYEIMDYLDTDGEGWWSPDNENINNSVGINIVPRAVTKTRSLNNPCDELAYVEETPDKIDIPLPYISWDKETSIMAVPFKTTAFINLALPDKNNTLIKYYNTALDCIKFRNMMMKNMFERKFHRWFFNNIVPHLNDDQLYLALANVLTLTNHSLIIHDDILRKPKLRPYSVIKSYLPREMPSKKVMILAILLFIEVVWFIPALVYLLCVKKKKDSSSNMYIYIRPRRFRQDMGVMHCEEKNKQVGNVGEVSRNDVEVQHLTPLLDVADANTSCTGQYVVRNSQVSYGEVKTQCPSSYHTAVVGTGSKSYCGAKNKFVETISADPCAAKESVLKTIPNKQTSRNRAMVVPASSQKNIHAQRQADKTLVICEVAQRSSSIKRYHVKNVSSYHKRSMLQKETEHCKTARSRSQRNVQKRENEQSTSLKSTKKTNDVDDDDIGRVILKSAVPGRCSTAIEVVQLTKSPTRKMGFQIPKKAITDASNIKESCQRQCTVKMSNSDNTTNVKNNISKTISENIEIPELKICDEKTRSKPEIFDTIPTQQLTNKFTHHDLKIKKSKTLSLKAQDMVEPSHAVLIDKPTIEICIGTSDRNRINQRRSRIPKPTNVHELVTKLSGKIQKALSPDKIGRQKSFIPQLKRIRNDGSILSSDDCKRSTACDSRLNETI